MRTVVPENARSRKPRLSRAGALGSIGDTPLTPATADAIVVATWVFVAVDGVLQARRARAARTALGPVVTRPWRGGIGVGAVAAAAALVAAALVEGVAGRLPFQPVVAAAGIALAVAGATLHARARRALGPLWSGPVEVRAAHQLVRRGPYAYVRHPIYAAFLLLAAGTLLAHPSVATACLAAGLASGLVAKLAIEDRTLRATLGTAYGDYARDVPALIPRRRRARDAAAR